MRHRTIARLAYELDARYDAVSRRVRHALGLARPLRILPYRGFGTPTRACIKARVLEDRHVRPPAERHTLVGSAIASYKRFATREVPGARVVARWGDRTWEGVTDEEGFLDLWVEPPSPSKPGWHHVALEVVSPRWGSDVPRAEAPLLIAGEDAEFGVISDLDDTVIVTGVSNLLKRAWSLFLPDHRVRLPFEGVRGFYQALRDGTNPGANNPIFYVSSSPWNLYEHIDEFLATHDIPRGPVLLRDWGITANGFAPGGGHGHKLDKIRLILEAFHPLPFILIGDSSQEDARHYRTIVAENPSRIRCVYIRRVPSRRDREIELSSIAADVRALGVEFLLVDDTVGAARHAAARGFIRSEGVATVEESKQADQTTSPTLEKVLEVAEKS